jgi:hypothetical protein
MVTFRLSLLIFLKRGPLSINAISAVFSPKNAVLERIKHGIFKNERLFFGTRRSIGHIEEKCQKLCVLCGYVFLKKQKYVDQLLRNLDKIICPKEDH